MNRHIILNYKVTLSAGIEKIGGGEGGLNFNTRDYATHGSSVVGDFFAKLQALHLCDHPTF